MKQTFYALFLVHLLLLVPACQRIVEEYKTEEIRPSHMLVGVLESKTDTKTELSAPDDQGIYYPFWTKGDKLALYADGINIPGTYSLVEGAGTGKGSFMGSLYGSRMVALYPVADITSEGIRGQTLTIELPAKQQYAPGSFGRDAYPMIAVTSNEDLSFNNLCAVLKLSLKGEEAVKSIKFISADSRMPVSGKATIRTDYAIIPELVMSEGGSSEVTLECGYVKLNPILPTTFFLVIPPGTYNGGFSLEIETFHGTVTRSTSADITFERSQFRSIPTFRCEGEGEIDPDDIPYNQIWYT